MKKLDKKLLILCSIVFINCLTKYYIPAFSFLQYICLFIHLIIIFTAKKDEYIPITLFNHTCSSLYDDIGFQYIFNITFIIFIIKLLMIDKAKLEKKTFSLLIIIMAMEIILTFINIGMNSGSLNLITMFGSYIFVLLMINKVEFIDKNKILKYFFVGFVVSALSGYMLPVSRWGTSIPTSFRYKGLLRDSNYYSVDALLIMTASMYEKRGITKTAIITFIVGVLAVSKMFIIISILEFFAFALYSILNIKNKKRMFRYLIILLSLPVIISVLVQTSFVSTIISKYTYRTDTTSFLTGRDVIQKYYFETAFNDPITLIFGRSTSYALVLNAGTNLNDAFYTNIVAHNTYLDLILSWGAIGTLIYISLLISIKKLFNNKTTDKYKIGNLKSIYLKTILWGSILACLFALSYLMLDFFAIMYLFLIIFSSDKDVKINANG